MEINRDNINTLIKAYMDTDAVFQSRGLAPGLVNLTGYLREGNLTYWTSTNNVRETMSRFDVNELNKDVKAALIEYTIGILTTPEKTVNLDNHVHTVISSWVEGVQGNIEFDELYERMIRDNRFSKSIYESLCIGPVRYKKGQINMEAGTFTPYLLGTINFLERIKQDVLNQDQKREAIK